MPDVIQAGAVVEKSTEVEYAVKNPRIEKFIKSLENNCWRTAKDLGQFLGGSKYNYVFNDYGIHGVGYSQEIFCRLYFKQLNYMLQKFVGNIFKGYEYKKKFAEKSIEYDNLWKRIVDDAEAKGAVVNSNEYELGLYFYVILYLRCIYELNKESNKIDGIQSLKLLQGYYEGTINVSFESPDDMQKIIDEIRNNLESGALNLEKAHSIIDSIDSSVSIQEIIDRLDSGYEFDTEFDTKEKSLDECVQIEEPKQPEPVEDIYNKDETLENKDKQIDDDLSSEENKDINAETDNNNIEGLSDTDTEETDMRVVKDTVKHEAFGVQIDFDIPDFIKVSDAPDIVEEFEEMQYDIRRGLSSESENNKLFFADFSGSRESFKDNIICVYDTVFKRPTYDSVSVLTILYLMHSGLMGLNPDSTENDILAKIQDQDWIDELCSMYIYLVDIFFVTEKYEIREEAN